VAKYLTQEWLDEGRRLAADQPERPGASARIQYLVTGAPDGDVRYWWVVEDGRIVESQIGELDDPDFTLTMTYETGTEIARGELDPNVAFMQGRMKCAGDAGKLMQLIPITGSPEYRALQAELRETLEF
jgi:alkyl sulfatase BDS1-like metallo-beta-lactamase superfamily hydrolase